MTGNSLHESSSAPQQRISVQYIWFALYLHGDVSHTDMLQPHFISCRGVSGGGGGGGGGRRQHARIQEFLSVLFSPQLILQRGSNGFIPEKTIPILYKGSRGGPLFSGGGGSTFFQGGGPNANFYRNTYMYLLFSRGSVLVVASWHIDIFNKCPDLRNLMIYQQDCLRKCKISTLCNCFYMCFI